VADVQRALEALPSVGLLEVYNTRGSGARADPATQLACPGGGAEHGGELVVRFLTDGGDLPPLTHSVLGAFDEVLKGRRQPSVGALPFRLALPKASDAFPTYVRVAAYTSIGFGPYAEPTPTHLRAARRAPSSPTHVTAAAASKTSVVVGWGAPASNGGDAVDAFVVQVDRLPTFTSLCGDGPELQTLTVTGAGPLVANGGGGGFKLIVNGDFANPVEPFADSAPRTETSQSAAAATAPPRGTLGSCGP
jgi:hypothetical protein